MSEPKPVKPYASSPCQMHEVDPAYMGLDATSDPAEEPGAKTPNPSPKSDDPD